LHTLQNLIEAAHAAAAATQAATLAVIKADPAPRRAVASLAVAGDTRPLAQVIEQALTAHRRRQETARATQQAMAARNAYD